MSATIPAGSLVSAGSRVHVEAETRAGLDDVAAAAGVKSLAPATSGTPHDVRLVLERGREPFKPGARPVTRGVSVAPDGTTTIGGKQNILVMNDEDRTTILGAVDAP